jgi:hypothetical protein
MSGREWGAESAPGSASRWPGRKRLNCALWTCKATSSTAGRACRMHHHNWHAKCRVSTVEVHAAMQLIKPEAPQLSLVDLPSIAALMADHAACISLSGQVNSSITAGLKVSSGSRVCKCTCDVTCPPSAVLASHSGLMVTRERLQPTPMAQHVGLLAEPYHNSNTQLLCSELAKSYDTCRHTPKHA